MLLITKRTTINLIVENDIEEVRNLHNDHTVLFQLSDTTYVTKEMQKLWFENLSSSSKSFRYVCRSLDKNELVGVFRVDNMDSINKSVMVGLDVAVKYRRKGYAVEIYQFFIKYFFEIKKFHRIYLTTLESNIPALSLYSKLGFTLEGIQREAIWRNGSYVNLLNYSLIFED